MRKIVSRDDELFAQLVACIFRDDLESAKATLTMMTLSTHYSDFILTVKRNTLGGPEEKSDLTPFPLPYPGHTPGMYLSDLYCPQGKVYPRR